MAYLVQDSWTLDKGFKGVVYLIQVRVGFLDYGGTEAVKKSDLKYLPDEFLNLPFQGIACTLQGTCVCACAICDLLDMSYCFNRSSGRSAPSRNILPLILIF